MPRPRSLPWSACSAARPRERSPGVGNDSCIFDPQGRLTWVSRRLCQRNPPRMPRAACRHARCGTIRKRSYARDSGFSGKSLSSEPGSRSPAGSSYGVAVESRPKLWAGHTVPTVEDRGATMDDQAAVPEAPPEPARADPIAGELVTETFEYDGGRDVTVYVPRVRPRQSCSPVTVS